MIDYLRFIMANDVRDQSRVGKINHFPAFHQWDDIAGPGRTLFLNSKIIVLFLVSSFLRGHFQLGSYFHSLCNHDSLSR